MKKRIKKTFKEALVADGVELGTADRTRKIGTNLYAHYWDDGMIQRRDLYIFYGKTPMLESSWQRYNSYENWFMPY